MRVNAFAISKLTVALSITRNPINCMDYFLRIVGNSCSQHEKTILRIGACGTRIIDQYRFDRGYGYLIISDIRHIIVCRHVSLGAGFPNLDFPMRHQGTNNVSVDVMII